MSASDPAGVEIGFEDDGPGTGRSAALDPALAAVGHPVDTVHEPLSAASLLQRFRLHRPEWFAGLQAESDGIETLLARDADLSTRWQGLPGLDHRSHWDRGTETSQPRRCECHAEWQPPLWAMAPVVRRQGGTMKLRLPPALTAAALQQAVIDHCPKAWLRHDDVRVRVEIETRLYWGARSPADGLPWMPAAEHRDSVGLTAEILEIERGTPRWLVDERDAVSPTITRNLRAGVGLMVAMPVVLYSRRPRPLGRWRKLVQRALDWFDRLRGVRQDCDPTFIDRLKSDEPYWAAGLGQKAPGWLAMRQVSLAGARLAPASAAALGNTETAPVHVLLLHGGLTSALAGFEAWLAPDPKQRPLWTAMPLFEQLPVWRFEHDTFLEVGRNIDDLIEALQAQVIGRRREGRLVLLAHSRGGVVARFALPELKDRWPGWDFQALTAGSPHLGTDVFERLGQRWVGLAGAVGLLSGALREVGSRSTLAKLKNLERGMAGDIPPGFRDLLPANVLERAERYPWPEGQIVTWGSQWRAEVAADWRPEMWHRLIEGFAGFEADGDGMIPLDSAKHGQQAHDASPVFHTEYFAHPDTAAQIRAQLERLARR